MGARGRRRRRDRARGARPHVRRRRRALDRRFQDRAATKAPTSRRSSIAKRSAIASSSSAMRDSCGARSAADPARPLLPAAARLARVAVHGAAVERRPHQNLLKFTALQHSEALRAGAFAACRSSADGPVALTIGNFDGVHRGHQAMLSRLIEAAEDLRAAVRGAHVRSASARVLRARLGAAAAVVAAQQARSASRAFGVARTIVARFDHAARRAVAGRVHRRRAGAPARRPLGAGRRGLPLRQGPRRRHRDAARRSEDVQRRGDAHRRGRRRARVVDRGARTRWRPATSRTPRRCSGRPFTIAGRVAHGAKLGRALGFPTANIRLRRMPPVVRHLRRARARPRRDAAAPASPPSACVRRSPTDGEPLLEVFIFDFDRADLRPARRPSNSCTSCATRSVYPTSTRSRARSAPTWRGARVFRRGDGIPSSRRADLPFDRTIDYDDPHARRPENRLQDHAQPARHAVPDARRSRASASRAGSSEWQQSKVYEAIRKACAGPPALRAARRAAVRERRHPHRPRAQQDPEGPRRQEPDDGGLRRAVRAGLGLPRHADRGADREDARQAPAGRGDAAALPRLRDRADRAAEGAVPAARRAGRLGPSVHDDGLRQRGRRNPHARQAARKGLSVSRPEARQLVLRLPERARRGRSRVRGPAGHRDRRRLPRWPMAERAKLAAAFGYSQPLEGPVVRGDLDDDAVDDSRRTRR